MAEGKLPAFSTIIIYSFNLFKNGYYYYLNLEKAAVSMVMVIII